MVKQRGCEVEASFRSVFRRSVRVSPFARSSFSAPLSSSFGNLKNFYKVPARIFMYLKTPANLDINPRGESGANSHRFRVELVAYSYSLSPNRESGRGRRPWLLTLC
jgi:hypothetical protein